MHSSHINSSQWYIKEQLSNLSVSPKYGKDTVNYFDAKSQPKPLRRSISFIVPGIHTIVWVFYAETDTQFIVTNLNTYLDLGV